jgi:hypothetical protein
VNWRRCYSPRSNSNLALRWALHVKVAFVVPVRSMSKNLVRFSLCVSLSLPVSIHLLTICSAHAVHAGISDPKYEYLYDLTEEFCERKDIKAKYLPLVAKVCPQLLEEDNGWRNTFVMPFESEISWDDILTAQKLLPKKKQVFNRSSIALL